MKRLAALSKRVGEGGRGVKRWGCWPRGPRRGKTPDSHSQDQRLLKREYDTQIHRALKTVEERRNPFKHHKNPPVILRLQEGRGMPSRETRGEFPALCGGEDWEEVQAELDRERRNPTANTPSAPGAAPVRRRPPHPRRQLALEGRGKAGHTLHLPLPGAPTASGREGGGRWKVSWQSPAPHGRSPEAVPVLGLARSAPGWAAAPLLCWLWTRVPLLWVSVGPEARPAAGPSWLLLFRLVPAGCSLLAPAMPELILQTRLLSARCSFRMRDPPP